MKQELLEKIVERSKSRKDGIYVFDCVKYVVSNGQLMFLIDFNKVFQYAYGFLVDIGTVERFKGRAKLKELMTKYIKWSER